MSGANETVFLEEDEEIGAEDENEEIVEVFSCKYCDFQATDIEELDEHIISHDEAILEDNHEEEADSEITNDSKFSLNTPFSISGPTNFGSSPEQPPKRIKQCVPAFFEEFKNKPDKRVFVCPYCGYQTMKKLDMNKHLTVHSAPVEVPVYACAECPYTTRRKCDMPKHLLTHCKDGSVTMYKCSQCPYATKRKGDLPKHMLCHKKAESDTTVYQCQYCSYCTRRRGDLKKHLLSHDRDFDGGRENILNCTECGYVSKRLNDLHRHVVLHCDKVEAVQGILKCKKCDFATEVSSRFAKHVLSKCQVVDIVPESVQDYIVLEEDELHLYQLDKESLTSVDISGNATQVPKTNAKRKRTNSDGSAGSEHSDVDNFYVDGEGLEERELLEEVTYTDGGDKVLVLAGDDMTVVKNQIGMSKKIN